jgi:hypothetical protein
MYKVPQYLHKPNQILWWEVDEAIFILIGIVFWMSLGMWFGLAGFVGLYFYSKGKKKYSRGFFRHLPMILGLENMPIFGSIFVRKYYE